MRQQWSQGQEVSDQGGGWVPRQRVGSQCCHPTCPHAGQPALAATLGIQFGLSLLAAPDKP